jgi:hypothetical protein
VRSYWFHSSISYPLAKFMQGLLPENADDAAWRDLVPHTIEHLDELGAEKDDDDWMHEVREAEGAVVVCLRKRHPVISAMSAKGLRIIALPEVFAGKNAMEQAHMLTGAWTNIVKVTHKAKAGDVFKVSAKNLSVEKVTIRDC